MGWVSLFFHKQASRASNRASNRCTLRREKGVALVLALSFLALSAVTVTAFLLWALSAEKLASRFCDANLGALQLGSDAALVLKDLQHEILAGSLPFDTPASTQSPSVLLPATPRSLVPFPAGKNATLPPNLLKQSAAEVPFFAPTALHGGQPVFPQSDRFPPSCRASNISTLSPSREGRWISPTRWNQSALLPRKKHTSVHEKTPAEEGSLDCLKTKHAWKWVPPDWILVQNNGEQPTHWNRNHCWQPGSLSSVSHRFAYQIYELGGLLDLNVAGSAAGLLPAGTTARRGHCGLADLTRIGLPSGTLSKLMTWRNSGTLALRQEPPFGHPYLNFLFCGPVNHGFLRTASGPGARGAHAASNHAVVSRRHLIQLVLALADTTEKNQAFESLQYLTHFSRALDQPSFRHGSWNPMTHLWERPLIVPPTAPGDLPYHPQSEPRELLLWKNYRGGNDAAGGDAVINPAILEVRVQRPFLRNCGAEATIEQPLVNTRFPLSRIRWITPRGPSASLPKGDPRYCADGTPEAIHASFGLQWNARELSWNYEHGLPTGPTATSATHIGTLSAVASAAREADFFELLKASLIAGSLGKAAATDHPGSIQDPPSPYDASSYQQQRDRSLDLHVLQIGANLIDQYDTDHFPTIIAIQNRIPNGANPHPKASVVRGIEDLPYFHRLHLRGVPNADDLPNPPPNAGSPLEITDSLPAYRSFQCGTTSLLALPEIWNPHAAADRPQTGEIPTQFRCIAVSEDPDGFCPLGSPTWAAENRFRLRPSIAFAGLRHPNDAATLWFTHEWPESGGRPSLSNDLAARCGFWADLYQNAWAPSRVPKDLYSVWCFPFFCLPPLAGEQGFPSTPSPEFYVDRYHQGVAGSPAVLRFFALGERNAPVQTVPYGATTAEVEVRGSELLFEITQAQLFREPTTLCRPGYPAGSALRAGPTHWLSGATRPGPTRGYLSEAGASGNHWLGFSLGERPTSWIMASKVVGPSGEDVLTDQYGWDPALGARETTAYGSLQKMEGPASGTGRGWFEPSLYSEPKVRLWRFFQITGNVARLEPALFTLRLQYWNAVAARWVTYDERYLQCEGDFDSRFDFRRFESDPDGSGQAWYPSDNHQRSAPLPWKHNPTRIGSKTYGSDELGYGRAVVNTYDPRTSRFGHPVTPAFHGFSFYGVMPDFPDSTLSDRWVDPVPCPDGKTSGPPTRDSGPLKQSGATLRPTLGAPRQTATLIVPGGYAAYQAAPSMIGWFPNQVWDSPQRKVLAADTSNLWVAAPQPPRFGGAMWLPGGQSGNPYVLRTGWLVENRASPLRQYYADADDIVRRASGAYAASQTQSRLNASTGLGGLPSAQPSEGSARMSRPIVLNRPFYSVAEMGYAFRGVPWKHLDFFTPESGDAALLDTFCVGEPAEHGPLTAGKVNLNTKQTPVLEALLTGVLEDELQPEKLLSAGLRGEATLAAKALVEYTMGTERWQGPLGNVSELVSRALGKNGVPSPPDPSLSSTTPCYTYHIPPDRPCAGAWSFTGFTAALDDVFVGEPEEGKAQRIRESVVRALADAGQTRVWNLMLDILVQTGKYPRSSTSGADFLVECETRAWIYTAIDRFTGEILDKQIEWVTE